MVSLAWRLLWNMAWIECQIDTYMRIAHSPQAVPKHSEPCPFGQTKSIDTTEL